MRPRGSTIGSEWFRHTERRVERQDQAGDEIGKRQDGCLSRKIQRERQRNNGAFQGIPSTGMLITPLGKYAYLTGLLSGEILWHSPSPCHLQVGLNGLFDVAYLYTIRSCSDSLHLLGHLCALTQAAGHRSPK